MLPYNDDVNAIGTCAAKVNRDRYKAAAALAGATLTTDQSKASFSAGGEPYKEAIGLAWWKDGTLTVKPSHALPLFRTTNRIVATRRATPSEIRHAVGLWTYALLLRRPAFSILYETFRFIEEAADDVRTRIPNPVVEELGSLLGVFPLLCADLSQPLSTSVYFSDGCATGAGVQYAKLSPRDTWLFKDNIAETRARKGWHSSLLSSTTTEETELLFQSTSPAVAKCPLKRSSRFERVVLGLSSKTAVKHKWLRPGHINLLETEEQLLAIRHMASCPSSRECRVLVLVDNTSTLGEISKGRSSSVTINSTCKKIAHTLLRNQITKIPHWVPSELNIADEPSRAFENVLPQRPHSGPHDIPPTSSVNSHFHVSRLLRQCSQLSDLRFCTTISNQYTHRPGQSSR